MKKYFILCLVAIITFSQTSFSNATTPLGFTINEHGGHIFDIVYAKAQGYLRKPDLSSQDEVLKKVAKLTIEKGFQYFEVWEEKLEIEGDALPRRYVWSYKVKLTQKDPSQEVHIYDAHYVLKSFE